MPSRRIFLGLLAVAVGTALLVDRLQDRSDVADLARRWWPLLLIVVGLKNLVQLVDRPWMLIGPIIAILAGAMLVLVTLDHLERALYPLAWPAALILAGTTLALAGADRREPPLEGRPELRQFVFLRGKRIVSEAEKFWRADITVVFGSLELDLRRAPLHPRASVNVNAIFGSVDVVVASGVAVWERRPFVLGSRGLSPRGVPPPEAIRLTVNVLGFFGDAATKHAVELATHRAASTE
jgi:Domain of unknown function (DUF5668)